MKIVLLAFPQHVALRDGDAWVSPVRDIARYIEVSRRYFVTRWAAFRYVAGGLILGTVFTTGLCLCAMQLGLRGLAVWVAYLSLAMYLVNVLLMDLPWAILNRRAFGDTSGLWQIAKLPAVAANDSRPVGPDTARCLCFRLVMGLRLSGTGFSRLVRGRLVGKNGSTAADQHLHRVEEGTLFAILLRSASRTYSMT